VDKEGSRGKRGKGQGKGREREGEMGEGEGIPEVSRVFLSQQTNFLRPSFASFTLFSNNQKYGSFSIKIFHNKTPKE
jgi:hypothetical protein